MLSISRNQVRPAFTLAELMIVIGAIGILSGIVVTAINPRDRIIAANDVKRAGVLAEYQKIAAMAEIDPQYVEEFAEFAAAVSDLQQLQNPPGPVPLCGPDGAAGTCVPTILFEQFFSYSPIDPVAPRETNGFSVFRNKAGRLVFSSDHINQGPGGGEDGPACIPGGAGTANSPTKICDCQALSDIRNNIAAHYALGKDINCSSLNPFTPISDLEGSLEGNGHQIKNVTLDGSQANDNEGLFRSAHGDIRNLQLEVVIDDPVNQLGGVGGLVGYNYGTITNCSVSGTVDGAAGVGGLAGLTAGTITDSSSTATVRGQIGVGGLVGATAGGGRIEQSHTAGEVFQVNRNISGMTNRSMIGGLVGEVRVGTTVSDSDSASRITALSDGYVIGGLAGVNRGTITHSYAAGEPVAGLRWVGGLVGINQGTIDRSYASRDVTASSMQFGGLVGVNDGSITNSYATGLVHSDTAINGGGLVGMNNTGIIRTSYAAGDVQVANPINGDVGGITGRMVYDNASATNTITDVFAANTVTVPSNGGGITGIRVAGILERAYWTGNMSHCYTQGGSPQNNGCPSAGPEAAGEAAFYGKSHAVFAAWDFETIWQDHADELPTLR